MLSLEAMGLKRAQDEQPEAAADRQKSNKTQSSAASKAAGMAVVPATTTVSTATSSNAYSAMPPPPAPTTSRSRRQQNTEQDKGIIMQLAKLTLSNARGLAAVESAVITTMIFNKEEGAGKLLHDELKAVANAYTNTVKTLAQDKKAEYAPPHTYVWQGLITFVHRHTMEVAEGPMHRANKLMVELTNIYIDGAKQELQTEDKEIYIKHVPHVIGQHTKICRLSKCWNAKMAKLQIMTGTSTMAMEVNELVSKFMVINCNAKVKMGAAPRTDAERRIQAWIDTQSTGA
eukprot:TRINITY_DN44150_c0_g1_i1.p2 TRINITY_DN44150_c0_g1~~TRINITY_DN44150_c0_g1_i1.p2  ORF type:complete len:288 (+),score=104.60 TRINITY_DN44150_c0_g1_i1:76-939(+)